MPDGDGACNIFKEPLRLSIEVGKGESPLPIFPSTNLILPNIPSLIIGYFKLKDPHIFAQCVLRVRKKVEVKGCPAFLRECLTPSFF